MRDQAVRTIARNRRARHEYEVLETLEAGLVLEGTEVKQLRAGRVSLKEAWIKVKDGEAWLVGCHIPPYPHGTHRNHEPERPRKLLLSAREIHRLDQAIRQRGLTAVPLDLHFRGPWAKVQVAIARGRRLHDKREALKKAAHRRELRQEG